MFTGYLSTKRAGVASFMLLALSCAAQAEQSNGLLDGLLKSKADSVCFRREYAAAHLKRHTGQKTEAIMLSFRRDAVRIELKQKDRKTPRTIVASCDWSTEPNRDVRNHPIPLKKAALRLHRHHLTGICPGRWLCHPASDEQSLMLYIDDPVIVQDGLAKDDPASSLRLGREDRQFQLSRTDAALCKPMDDALAATGL